MWSPKLRRGIALRAGIVAVVLLAFSLAGFLGGAWWILDIAAHFRVQYLVVAVLLTAVLGALRSRWALPAAAALIVNLACIAPIALRSTDGDPGDGAGLRVVTFNVNKQNTYRDDVVSWLARTDADVIFVYEVDLVWLDALRELPGYRVALARPASDNFGIAALTTIETSTARVRMFGAAEVASIELTVPWHGRDVVLLGTHPVPPGGGMLAGLRDEQLEAIARWSKAVPGPHAVVGDLNATEWSTGFRRLIDGTSLRPTGGLRTTWPYGQPVLVPFRIAIDHVLVSGLVATEQSVGPHLGSDHRPIVAKLGLQE